MRPVLLALVLLLVGCGRRVHQPASTGSWPADVQHRALGYFVRLGGMLDRGWVVTKKPDGSSEHVGEALLWYGPARYAATCGNGPLYDASVLKMLADTGGGLLRYEPIGDYSPGKEVTFDDAVGFYLGVAVAVARCGDIQDWKGPFRAHLRYLADHGHELYAGTGAAVPPGLDLVVDLIAERLGLGPAPDPEKLTEAEGLLMGMLGGIQGKKTLHDADPGKYPLPACYQANLAELWLTTLEVLGQQVGQNVVDTLCVTSRGMDIPTWEHRCQRTPLSTWLTSGWTENAYEFRFQRCGWEPADGEGNQNPFLDFLYGAVRAFGPLDEATVGGGVLR